MKPLLGDQLNKYRTLFNPFYFGITSTIQNIIRDYNISNPMIGGEITKLSIDNNIIKADIVYNKEHDGTIIQVINLKDKTECGVILIHSDDKSTAIIQTLQGNDFCYASTLHRSNEGKIIMKILIKLCKFYKIKKILLADRSTKKIGKYELDLKIYYTLINGKPWYCQFGFINSNDTDQQTIIDNFNILNDKKVSDFPKEIFIHKKFIDIYDKYKNNDIKEFIRMLSLYDITIFYELYDKIYTNLGLKHIKNKEYYMNL
jgi:hypothetical protein